MAKEMIYGSEYLYDKGKYVMRKLGYTAAVREHRDGKIVVLWVKD